ncbi:MAG: Fic family protein [Candidatus Aureabacteria bacterium]|nr:Fic family protein [Candidatus Auribacterota bacterium]
MRTLEQIRDSSCKVPLPISWYLSELGRVQGAQDLFTKQSPQRLKVLLEHAIAQSAVSSNRIEGVEIDRTRVDTVVFGHPSLRNRDEEEVAGYRDALNLVHSRGAKLPVNEATILRLHTLSRGGIGDAGQYKTKPVDIIENRPDGSQVIRFQSVAPQRTREYTQKLVELWREHLQERRISPLILLAAFNLDFLCIHPFRDGNGRVSRLLLLLTCYHIGIEVGRYISLERFETLRVSSQGWHEGKHDPWPYIGYLLFILRQAYKEFEERVGRISTSRGEKAEIVLAAIRKQADLFRVSDIEAMCPGVGRDWIRVILFHLKKENAVICSGMGKAARWRYTGE